MEYLEFILSGKGVYWRISPGTCVLTQVPPSLHGWVESRREGMGMDMESKTTLGPVRVHLCLFQLPFAHDYFVESLSLEWLFLMPNTCCMSYLLLYKKIPQNDAA